MAELHSRLGASSTERWLNCPGSVAQCDKIPPRPETPESKEGTAAHSLASLCLNGGYDPDEMVGRFVEGYEITPKMAEAVGVYVRFVRDLFMPRRDRAKLFVEQRYCLKDVDPDCGGTADAVVYDADELTLDVVDFKFGAGVPVEVKGNRQLLSYGLGALIQLNASVDTIRLTVVQPRAEHPDGPIRSWSVYPDELENFSQELRAAAQRTRQPDAPLQDGPWCQFCDACAICPLKLAAVDQAEQYEIEDAIAAATGDTMDPEETGRRLKVLERLAHWAPAFRRFCFAEAQRGRVPADHKLVAVRGKRTWKDGNLAMRQALRAFPFDLGEDAVFSKRAVTPAQLEKLVGVDQAAEFIPEYVKQKCKAVTLVPASDGRPAVLPSALADFADLFEEENNDNGED